MMSEHDTFDREEIATLLPWYATARLDAADMARVETALKSDPALARQLALIEEDRHETVLGNEALGLPSSGLADRLMARIEAESPAPSRIVATGRGFIGRIGGFVAGLTSRQLGYAAVAAALLIAVQAAVITGQAIDNHGVKVRLASSKENTTAQVMVSFVPTANLADVEKLLAEHNATIVKGPAGSGLYELHLNDEPDGKAEITKAIAALSKRTDLIQMALPMQKGE